MFDQAISYANFYHPAHNK